MCWTLPINTGRVERLLDVFSTLRVFFDVLSTYIYPAPTTQYCVVGSSQKNVEKKLIQIKDNFQIQNNFRVRSSHRCYSCVKTFEPTIFDFETRFTSLFSRLL